MDNNKKGQVELKKWREIENWLTCNHMNDSNFIASVDTVFVKHTNDWIQQEKI